MTTHTQSRNEVKSYQLTDTPDHLRIDRQVLDRLLQERRERADDPSYVWPGLPVIQELDGQAMPPAPVMVEYLSTQDQSSSDSASEQQASPANQECDDWRLREMAFQEKQREDDANRFLQTVHDEAFRNSQRKQSRYLRRASHHIEVLTKRAKARIRKKSIEQLERTRQWANRNIVPCDLAGKFPEGERAVISYLLNCIKRTGIFHGYFMVIAEKVGVCTKTVTRALQRAKFLGIIRIDRGKFDGLKNGKSTIRIVSTVVYDWIKRCATAGLSSLTKGIKDPFFIRPATMEVMKSSGENDFKMRHQAAV